MISQVGILIFGFVMCVVFVLAIGCCLLLYGLYRGWIKYCDDTEPTLCAKNDEKNRCQWMTAGGCEMCATCGKTEY